MSDNGAAMTAAEICRGLDPVGHSARDYAALQPYQNGKQEAFWGQVEGRFLARLDHVRDLTLTLLNEAAQAWVEREYKPQAPRRDTTDADGTLAGRTGGVASGSPQCGAPDHL